MRKNNGLFTVYLRNCTVECPRVEAKIKGIIPKWLKGSLLRNGPGLRKIGIDEYAHLFDYSSLIRKYSIENGRVFYENKLLKSSSFKRNQEKQRIVVSEFGTECIADPCKTILKRFMSYFTINELFTDNTAVGFMNVGDEVYACGDTPYITKIEANSLDTVKTIDIRKLLAVNTLTSHPHTDADGNVYNMGSSVGHYNIVKIPRNNSLQNASIVAKIATHRPFNPGYYHSFCLTENYFVFIEQALIISIPTLIQQHFFGGANSNLLKWRPQYKNKFFLISRKDGSVVNQKYISEPFAFFHTINAYEEQNHVVVDICCYRDGNVLKALFTDAIKEAEIDTKAARRDAKYIASQAKRFVLPLLNSKDSIKVGENVNSLSDSKAVAIVSKKNVVECIPEALTEKSAAMAEMPTINYSRCNGKKYRYFYAICRRDDLLLQLMKCDTKTKAIQIWSENNCYPSEPIFVPHPHSVDEDDGKLFSASLT
ncbi:beta:beta-carotene 9':10'-oxygenase-like protein [Leptotrombidium deliense]|uniref:Beta:beta-carotene 9':10'-oxygenase-like protein n=1 Tax=Leptotrombidium deliense TaxID=299467 RepID=A0A443S9U2_9ACAR|nr:beta:beta-carotene 9':10'-oxygenase-like protein [Leptotrombidium deliense]